MPNHQKVSKNIIKTKEKKHPTNKLLSNNQGFGNWNRNWYKLTIELKSGELVGIYQIKSKTRIFFFVRSLFCTKNY